MNFVFLQLSESKSREEQIKQQMAEKDEKTKKVFLGAKTKISQLNSTFTPTLLREAMATKYK